jgi:hypothetical protein
VTTGALMRRIQVLGWLVVLGWLSGCGREESSPVEAKEVYDSSVMAEVADMYRSFVYEFKKPPAKAGDFKKYEALNGNGVRQVVQGEIVVLWGAPLAETPEAARAVLAYEKKVPEEGGVVLMQDGKTIQKISADEFKAAPKAAKG